MPLIEGSQQVGEVLKGDEILFVVHRECKKLGTDLATDACQTNGPALITVGNLPVHRNRNEFHPLVT